MRVLLSLVLSVLMLLGPGFASLAQARGERPARPPKATIVGGIAVGLPLTNPVITLADDSGRLKYVFPPSEVSSTGRFRLELKDRRLAKQGERLDFRATALGTLEHGRDKGWRFQRSTLSAVVRDFDPATDELHINLVTTLISAYLDAHPERSLAEATTIVKAFLDIPAYVDLGDLSAGSWHFDHARFLAAARAEGGLNRFIAKLVRAIDAGGSVQSFGAAEEPALAATGDPLTCINTVAWDHGTNTSLPPYVQVGATKYTRKIAGGIQVVVLNRQTLAHIADTAFTGDSAGVSQLQSYLATLNAGQLVIVAGPQAVVSQASPVVAVIGAAALIDQGGTPATLAGNWSVIGVPGIPYGQAFQSAHNVPGILPALPNCQGTSDGDLGSNLTGYLTLDSTGLNYTFVFAEFIPFDTRVPGSNPLSNTMQIGTEQFNNTLTVPGAANSIGGFQLISMDRRTGKVFPPDDTFPTAERNVVQGTIVPNAPYIEEMSELLEDGSTLSDPNPAGGDGPNQVITFLTSIGQPSVVETATFGTSMANALIYLGVNPHTFMTLTQNDTWSLVAYDVSDSKLTKPFAFEASSRITPNDPTGRLVGFLARNRQNQFVPLAADHTGELNYDLFPLALQPASPWPFANTTGYQGANTWIAGQLKLPNTSDVRLNYTNTGLGFGGTLFTLLTELTWPGTTACNCSEDEFDDLQTGLLAEFGWVDDVRTLIQNLKSPLDTSEVPEAVNLASIATQIENSLAPPNDTAETYFWFVMQGLATAISTGGGIPGLGLVVSGFRIAYDMTNGSGGSSLDPVKAQAQQLGAAVAAATSTALGTFNQLQDIIVSDYGRLSEIGQNAASNPDWAWSGAALNAATTYLTQSANKVFWGSLMPLKYHAYKLIPTSPNNESYTNANGYVCEGHDPETGGSKNVKPFNGAAASGQFKFIVDYASDKAQPSYWVWYSSVNNQGQATMPPQSLTDPLFQSTETTNGVGLYAPDFWWQNWKPNNLECPPDKFS